MAFTAFLAGKRGCIGKTFVEMAGRLAVPMLYHYFEFEMVDAK
jgi:cytochrome P450